MKNPSERLDNLVDEIVSMYPDFNKAVYGYILGAVEFASKQLNISRGQSVSAKDLILRGVIPFGFVQWGFLTADVLNFWGIRTGKDVGDIVERLVAVGVLKQDANDKLQDFEAVDLQGALLDFLK